MVNQKFKTTIKPENTTMAIPKELRNELRAIKYQYDMDYTYQVVQLLLNNTDLSQLAGEQLKKEATGNQSSALPFTSKYKVIKNE